MSDKEEGMMTKFLLGFLIVELICVVFLIGGIIHMNPQRKIIQDITYLDITIVSGLPIMENVVIQSPSLIIVIGEFEAFIEYCVDEQVYKKRNTYYVFNDDMTIAYRYTVSWTSDFMFFNLMRK